MRHIIDEWIMRTNRVDCRCCCCCCYCPDRVETWWPLMRPPRNWVRPKLNWRRWAEDSIPLDKDDGLAMAMRWKWDCRTNRPVLRRDGQNERVHHRRQPVVVVEVGRDRADKVTASVARQRRPLDGNKDPLKRRLLRPQPLNWAVLEAAPETWVRMANRIRWHLRTSSANWRSFRPLPTIPNRLPSVSSTWFCLKGK